MADKFDRVIAFLKRLRGAKIHFGLKQVRDETVMVEVCVPGERWEVEFMDDGTVEVEVFRSSGEMGRAEMLEDLFARFSD